MDFSDFYKAYGGLRLYGQHEKKEAKSEFKRFEAIVKSIEKSKAAWRSPESMRQLAEVYGDMVKVAQQTRQSRAMVKYQMKAQHAYQSVDIVRKAASSAPQQEKPQDGPQYIAGVKLEYFKNPEKKD